MAFTTTQVAAMSTDEKDARFCRRTNHGGYGMSGWDSPNGGDANAWLEWLQGLLWPLEYPTGYPRTYCATLTDARAGAVRVGYSYGQDDSAPAIVAAVLALPDAS